MSVVRGRKSPKAESLQAMDEYLSSLGLVRKPIAKDGSCLFRAVAEQVFHCQARHLEVRERCIRYMDRHRDIFEAFVPGPFDHHLWTLQNPKEWAGQVEISALSLMYKCDFIIYQDVGRPPARVTENGFKDKVVLCFSHGNHYDSVYPKQFQIDAAMCQSIVYELLYKDVFKMDHDIAVVKDMLGNKQQKIRKDSTSECESSPSKNCGSDKPDSELEGSTELDVSTESDKSRDNMDRPNEKATQANGAVDYSKKDGRRFPLPFKVAKALDPEFYRNVEYDVWMDSKKEQQRQDMHLATMMQYAPGDKCQVRLEGNVKYYMAHVQEVQAESGPVTVFIEELGEKHTVPVKNLKPITQVPPVPTVPMPWTAVPAKGYKNLTGYYQKGAIVPQEIAACFSPPWHPFAEDPRNKRKNRRKGRENGIPPFMVQRVQPSLPPRLQHEGQYSPKYHHHGREYQGRDYQGRDYQSREYQGREYQGRDRDYQPRDRDREFQRPPHGQRYNGQASPRYQHYGRDYHSRDYQGRMYHGHGSPHGHRFSSQGRNQPPRFMRQDQMEGRGPGPRPGSRYQYSHGRGRGRGRNTPTPPPGPPQGGEMDEKQAIEESIVLYELQQRDPDAFPALPTSNGQVQHVQSNTVWGRGRGRGMGRRTPTPPPPSTTPSDGGHSMTMEEGSLCSSMQELNMNERASPDGERICSPVSHQMEVPPMKRVMTPTKEFVPRSSRTPSPYQNPTPPLQSQSANAEISSSNSGSNQQMSTDSTSSPASTPNTPPPQTVAPNGYVPYMQPMHVPFYPIMIQATDNLTGPVNLNFGPSRDPYGNDLPHSDVSTLRFFYNLGTEYYRCCMNMMAIQHQQQEAAMANAYFYNQQAQGQVQQYQPASSTDGQTSGSQQGQEGEDLQQEGSDQLPPPNGQSQDKPLPQGAHVYSSYTHPSNQAGTDNYHSSAGCDYQPSKSNIKSCSDDTSNSNDCVVGKDVSVSRSNSMTSVQSSGDSASMNVQYGSDSNVCGSSVSSYVHPSPNTLQQTSSSTTVGSEDSSPDYTDSGVASEGSGSQSSIPRPTSLGPGLPKRHYMEHRGSPKLIPGRWSTPERSGSSDSLNQEAVHTGRPPYGPKRGGPRDRQPGFYRPSGYFSARPYMSQQPPRRSQYEGPPLYHSHQLYNPTIRYSNVNPPPHMSQPQQYYMNQYATPSRMALHGSMGGQAASMYGRAAGMYSHPSQQFNNVPPGVSSVTYPPCPPACMYPVPPPPCMRLTLLPPLPPQVSITPPRPPGRWTPTRPAPRVPLPSPCPPPMLPTTPPTQEATCPPSSTMHRRTTTSPATSTLLQ
ncbi:uncharacterized protein LOC144917039 isoform X3 [Branchiostoma floridae x Branchiostoma belcheri]